MEDHNSKKAKELLTWYFQLVGRPGGCEINGDSFMEIENIIDYIGRMIDNTTHGLQQRIDALEQRLVLLEAEKTLSNEGGIIGKVYEIKGPILEGVAKVLGVNDDDTVNVQSVDTGKIYIVTKDDLFEVDSYG